MRAAAWPSVKHFLGTLWLLFVFVRGTLAKDLGWPAPMRPEAFHGIPSGSATEVKPVVTPLAPRFDLGSLVNKGKPHGHLAKI
jgi:hypothetical protein